MIWKYWIVINLYYVFNYNYISIFDNFFTIIYHLVSIPLYNILLICVILYYLLSYFFNFNKLIFFQLSALFNIFYFNHISLYYFIKINVLLLNPLNSIHPILLYSFFCFYFIIIVLSLLLYRLFFLALLQYLIYSLIVYSQFLIILFITIYLGSWWAFQESNWGGWWVWDVSEFFLVIIIIVSLGYSHTIFFFDIMLYLYTNYLSFFILYFFWIINKLMFVSTLHSFYSISIITILNFKISIYFILTRCKTFSNRTHLFSNSFLFWIIIFIICSFIYIFKSTVVILNLVFLIYCLLMISTPLFNNFFNKTIHLIILFTFMLYFISIPNVYYCLNYTTPVFNLFLQYHSNLLIASFYYSFLFNISFLNLVNLVNFSFLNFTYMGYFSNFLMYSNYFLSLIIIEDFILLLPYLFVLLLSITYDFFKLL